MAGAAKSHSFIQEVRHTYDIGHGLLSLDVRDLAITCDGSLYAATSGGLCQFQGERWTAVDGFYGLDLTHLVPLPDGACLTAGAFGLRRTDSTVSVELPNGSPITKAVCTTEGEVIVASGGRLHRLCDSAWTCDEAFSRVSADSAVLSLATGPAGAVAVGTASGLFLLETDGEWRELHPSDGVRRWYPSHVSAATFDGHGRLWFGCSAGAGVREVEGWRLYTPAEVLPYTSFTTAASRHGDTVWFGTLQGALRQDGHSWSVRASKRWVPNDAIRAIAIAETGDVWIATQEGVSRIEGRPMTLAQKASHFEDIIEERHLREGYFVTEVELDRPGDSSSYRLVDTDNDGLWTGMYGAGQCFLYAATGDSQARRRARRSLDGLILLSQVTGIPGFPARAVRPADGPDPNEYYSAEWNRWKKSSDPQWKDLVPRWPKSADGNWYWKTDTSSDELDGHYFLYGCYFDLVADTDEERQRVASVVRAITDHLLAHDYCLVDWDGTPTRWARFGPRQLNLDPRWINERGLNSLSMLSYLKVAEHVTGDHKYANAARDLIVDHGYLQNMVNQKITFPPDDVNDSDDEMAFMCYYNLSRYEEDPALVSAFRRSLKKSWLFERGERSPLFNYIYCALTGETMDMDESLDTLRRIPLELIPWRTTNSDRLDVDIEPYHGTREFQRRTFAAPGVLPVDERAFMRWNENPWRLDCSGGQGVSWNMEGKPLTLHKQGEGLAEYDGNMYLLPYYLGLYHGFVR